MPRKRKSNLSQSSNIARAKKVARFNETFPQAELRRLEQAEREAAHRAAETPEQSQARHRRHAEYLASQRAAETPEQSQARRLQHATYMASQRGSETIEAAESRKRAVAEWLCQNDALANTLLYMDVPRYYTWNVSLKEWKCGMQGTPDDGWPGVKAGDALVRIYTVHVSNFECYCLRMLLNVINDPTNFLDLKTVDGQEFETFRQACEKLRLLEDDNHWDATMEWAVLCRSPSQKRELFAILICTCGLSNPLQLWDKYKVAL
ncbi:uncharacterized protein TNCV_2942851 [Trichonephila clavipes]|nr:uncharacterized protein TNCV_2942851 [Trichonephila clavipes]